MMLMSGGKYNVILINSFKYQVHTNDQMYPMLKIVRLLLLKKKKRRIINYKERPSVPLILMADFTLFGIFIQHFFLSSIQKKKSKTR